MRLEKEDSELYHFMKLELGRQRDGLELIPSENFCSLAVMEAQGSVLTNKYSEGYPGKRYYGGNEFVDECEKLAIERMKKLFGAQHANVQPHAGSQANMAAYFALLQPGDKMMGLNLSHGGHLTHGSPVNFSGKWYKISAYNVDAKTHLLDYDAIEKQAMEEKPQLVVAGYTAYPRTIDFKRFREIADRSGAKLMVDMAHIAGLIAGGAHPSPFSHADVVTSTTHKTLRGPRGAFIVSRAELSDKIDKAVFPGLQGGPHNNTTAGIAIALEKAGAKSFVSYAKAIVSNAKILADELLKHGFKLATGGTDNHLMVVDVRPFGIDGKTFAIALEKAGIIVNFNTIPHDPNPPFKPSGIRLGTPAITARGMKTPEMKKIAQWIYLVAKTKGEDNKMLKDLHSQVKSLCRSFPIDLS